MGKEALLGYEVQYKDGHYEIYENIAPASKQSNEMNFNKTLLCEGSDLEKLAQSWGVHPALRDELLQKGSKLSPGQTAIINPRKIFAP